MLSEVSRLHNNEPIYDSTPLKPVFKFAVHCDYILSVFFVFASKIKLPRSWFSILLITFFLSFQKKYYENDQCAVHF